MTIHEIAKLTRETSPYFFSKNTLEFFGQTMESFTVREMPDGRFYISAPSRDGYGNLIGTTERIFDPETNKLLMVEK